MQPWLQALDLSQRAANCVTEGVMRAFACCSDASYGSLFFGALCFTREEGSTPRGLKQPLLPNSGCPSEVLHKHTQEPSCIQMRRILTVSYSVFQGKTTPSILTAQSGFLSSLHQQKSPLNSKYAWLPCVLCKLKRQSSGLCFCIKININSQVHYPLKGYLGFNADPVCSEWCHIFGTKEQVFSGAAEDNAHHNVLVSKK